MNFDLGFATASQAAIAGWLALILLPRWLWLTAALRYGLIGLLSLAYAGLVFAFFFRVEGGGFDGIAEVRSLFLSDPVLLAGWLHYLAFDLLIGTWEARDSVSRGVPRWLLVPCLFLTLMLGPMGWAAYMLVRSRFGRES